VAKLEEYFRNTENKEFNFVFEEDSGEKNNKKKSVKYK
jgi:hypothetical protein